MYVIVHVVDHRLVAGLRTYDTLDDTLAVMRADRTHYDRHLDDVFVLHLITHQTWDVDEDYDPIPTHRWSTTP